MVAKVDEGRSAPGLTFAANLQAMKYIYTIALALALSSLATIGNAQNAYLTNAFMPRWAKANTDYAINVRVRNSAATPLITFRVDWRWNNGPVQTGNFQSTTGITGNQYWPYPHPIAFNQPQGVGVLKIWVVGSGDMDHTNDTLTFPMGVLNSWATKTVIMEQFTGTWCQYCPDPNALTNTLDADPLVVVAKHHNADEFSSPASTAYWGQYNANFSPMATLEQSEQGTYAANANFAAWTAEVDLRKTGVSPVNLTINPEFNYWTGDLSVELTANFTYGLTGDFIVNAYIVEDNVPGPQTNAAPGYIHQQVVREVLGGGSGTSGVIPATTVAGVPYSHTYTYSVPANWNWNNLRIVATVSQRVGSTLHAVNAGSGYFVALGMEEGSALSSALKVYPNPSSTDLWFELPGDAARGAITLITADGREVLHRELVLTGNAMHVDGFETLAPGAYVLRVQRGDAIAEQRVFKLVR